MKIKFGVVGSTVGVYSIYIIPSVEITYSRYDSALCLSITFLKWSCFMIIFDRKEETE